jgi:hypothetical protein
MEGGSDMLGYEMSRRWTRRRDQEPCCLTSYVVSYGAHYM